MGQCQPSVMERINTDTTWDQVVANTDHLELMQLIRATVMSQTGDQYPFLTIQKQELNLQGHHQATVTTYVFFEKFNTNLLSLWLDDDPAIQFLFLYRQEWILVSCLRHHRSSN